MATPHRPSDKRALGSVHSNRGADGHSCSPNPSAHLAAGSIPPAAGHRGEVAHQKTGSDLRDDESSSDGSESAQGAVSDESLLVRSILDFNEDQIGLRVRLSQLFLPDGI